MKWFDRMLGRTIDQAAERRAEANQVRSDAILGRAERVLTRVEKVLDDEDRLASYRAIRLRRG